MGTVIYLWGGPWEARMRRPHEPPPWPLPVVARIVKWQNARSPTIREKSRNGRREVLDSVG
jgi:hypothetical protein